MGLMGIAAPGPSAIRATLAGCMFAPGLLCVVAPYPLLRLSLRPERRDQINALSLLLFRCFGAQACLVGTVLGFCEMTPTTFRAFATAMVPFFGFNFYYHFVDPWIEPLPMFADFINNAVMGLAALKAAMLLDGKKK
ncbi:hypothetical protein ACHAXT_008139 [Thalassiosira profunda]